jgi:bacteriorhodopsin
MTMLPYELSYADYSTVYNSLSFVMASMMCSTVYFFFHAHMVQYKYRTALCVSGLVTLIAFYHYMRIFNSWTEAYEFMPVTEESTDYICKASGKPFNDAYRYMDWLLTVPLLLIELILVMDLDKATEAALSVKPGSAAALMILLGYPGEITLDHGTRWTFWFLAMLPFVYIVYTLFVGLADAVDKQDPAARGLVSSARWVTIISWTTYPVVYILPMIGFDTANSALVGIQVGYSISDFVAKCVVGLMVTRIAIAKSKSAGGEAGAGLLGSSQSMSYGQAN